MAAVALAAWSIFLLDTTYLEPLPWTAGRLGVVLLLVTAFGAALVSGWRWRTLFLLLPCGVGLIHLSPSLFSSGRFSGDGMFSFDGSVLLLVLAPLMIAMGTLASRVRGTVRSVGLALLVLPLVIVAWAGFRHVYPIDRRPANPLLIEWYAGPIAYRGVKIGESTRRMLARLGKPDGVERGFFTEYAFGHDTVFVNPSGTTGEGRNIGNEVAEFEIEDANAETARGVGIGDSLAIAKRRYSKVDCYYRVYLKPRCEVRGLVFEGDPIDHIRVG